MGCWKFELSVEEIEQMAHDAVRRGDHGDHTAFAEAFLSLSCSRKEIYQKKMLELYTSDTPAAISRRENIQKDGKLRFMKPEYWRDGTVEYANAPGEYFYGKVYAMDRLNGVFGCSRELLVQLAICLDLSPGEADSYLLAAGEPMLYVLDPVDAAALFFLKKFGEEKKEGRNHAPSEKLAIVKTAQNELLKRLEGKKNISYKKQEVPVFTVKTGEKKSPARIREALCEEEKEFLRCLENSVQNGDAGEFTEEESLRFGIHPKGNSGNYFVGLPGHVGNTAEYTERYFIWNPKKKQLLRFTAKSALRQSFSQKLSLEIDKEIARLKEQFEGNEEIRKTFGCDEGFGSTTLYLTKLFERISGKAATFEEFMDFGSQENMGTVFAEKCYGFLLKTRQFLDEEKRYSKNIYPSTERLRLRRSFLVDVRIEPANTVVNITRQYKILTIDRIMSMYLTSKKEPRIPERCVGTWNMTEQMLNGREQSLPGGHGHFFTFEKKPKNVLMQYAVATGNEDELSEYLQLAGYWSADWVRWIEEGVRPEALGDLDLTDYLCLYAFACRKQYLEAWEESARKAKTFALAPFMAEQRRDFPMASLILLIEDAILKAFVSKMKTKKADWENEKKLLVKNVFLFSPEEKNKN